MQRSVAPAPPAALLDTLLIFHRSQMQTTSVGSAVLDLHFSHLEKDVLAVATSVGLIRIYHLQTLNAPPALQLMQDLQVFPTSVLILSLAWHPFKPSRLATSLSTGEVAILDYGQSLRPLWTFRAHSLEAWTVAWSYSQQMNTDSLVFSGGDDSTLYAYELETLPQQEMLERSGPDKQRTNLIRRDVKIHGAGVTAILPLHDQYVVTGSYDEFVRLLEPVENRRWKVVAETRLGGGVWRIKLLTYQQFAAHTSSTWNILVSCMHAGTRLLAIGYCVDNGWSINILAKFEEHQSMNYASDATTLEDHKDSDLNKRITTVVSTSFYDRKLCIWELALSHQMTVAGNMQIAHK